VLTPPLDDPERRALLRLARQSLQAAARGQPPPAVDAAALPPRLLQPGACFVTLTVHDGLRGCIGGLEPQAALYLEVQQRAAQAARHDYRFPPVAPDELPQIEVEVSVLTPPQPLPYASPDDLLARLQPGVDGVILRYGQHRATFLPQVWERAPEPAVFLSMLCDKLGARRDLWRRERIEVQTYRVEMFTEADYAEEAAGGAPVSDGAA